MDSLTILTLALVVFCIYMIRKSKNNFIYICLIEAMFPVRFYSDLYGVPVMVFLPLCYIAFYAPEIKFRRFPWIMTFFSLLTLYMFLSYYHYFDSFYIVLFNNLLWLFIMFCSISSEQIEEIEKVSFGLFRKMGIVISCMIFLSLIVSDERLFGNPRQVAFYLVICFLGVLVDKKRDLKRTILLFVFFLSVLFSGGRLPLTILIVCFTLYIFLFTRSWFLKAALVFTLACLPILAQTDFVQSFLFREEKKDYSSELVEDGAFTSGRAKIYECAWEQFSDHPFLGLGYLSFKSPDNIYNIFWGEKESKSCHSVWLQYLAEIGIVGTLLYLIVLLWFLFDGIWLMRHSEQIDIFYTAGQFYFLFGIVFVLGATVDNHGFHYRIIFVVALLMFLQKEFIQKKTKEVDPIPNLTEELVS